MSIKFVSSDFYQKLMSWPKDFIKASDLVLLLAKTPDARYSWVKRAIANGRLNVLRKGLYVINKKDLGKLPNLFELAQQIKNPSYISLESALSYHGLIPEAVYTTTSVCPKRDTVVNSDLGIFSYVYTPLENFYLGVERIESDGKIFFISSAWKALADFVYVYRKSWQNLNDIEQDMRIETLELKNIDNITFANLQKNYPSKRVRQFLNKIQKEIFNE